METTTETTTPAPLSTWMKGRDDYGRTSHEFYTNQAADGSGWGAKGVVVRLPRSSSKVTEGTPYLANAWGQGAEPGHGLVTYHRTLAVAKAWLEGRVL